ncbi:MAG: Ig-like domain-containing protein [Paludibacteraceae bacterium]|nr:Ig-like domain-containing protein [Paludibacteraceae bacterium]
MKTFTNLIKRASLSTFNKKRYYLFIIMLLTLGIGSAWAETASKEWDLTSSSSEWTNCDCVTYFSQPYGIKKKGAYIINKNIPDFINYSSTASSIEIGVKSLCNGDTPSQLTISLVDASGNVVGSGQTITPDNASAGGGETPGTGGGSANVTYDFTKIDGFSSWPTSYANGMGDVVYTEATVKFTGAIKQAQTITDCPVTKGGQVQLVLNEAYADRDITNITFVCRQWGTKAQTITLHYSTDKGVNYTTTEITSTDFTISSAELPEGTNAVKITFFSSSNQVGIESVTFSLSSGEGSSSGETPTPSVSVAPASYTFATTNVGETATQEFTITAKSVVLSTLSASIDNTTDFAVSAITGDKVTVTYQPKSAGDHTATMTVKAGEEASTTVALTGKAVAALEGTWILVTDASSLNVGDKIIIAAKESDVALSTTQAGNNRPEVAITKNDNTITATSETQVLTLQAGNKENTLALYTGDGYLYAASSSNNYLRTETTLSDNSSWTISIADGTATLTAQGTYTRNTMFYNQSSKIFACYASNTTTQKAIAIYKNTNGKQLAGLAYATTQYLTKLGDAFTTPTLTNPNSLTVTYSSSDNNVATVDNTGTVAIKAAGVVTITASFAGNSSFLEGSAKYTLCVTEHAGTEADPYSVADARRVIDVMETAEGVYATGIVSEIVTAYNATYGNITYNISIDGSTAADQLQAYRGKGENGENFSSADDIKVGDEVVIKGNLKLHNGTLYEFDADNQLVSLKREKQQAGLAYEEKEHTANVGEDFTEPTLTNPNSLTVTYSSSNAALATVDATTGEVSILAAGKVTITASSAADATYAAGSASYNITITDPSLAVATLPFTYNSGKAAIETTAGITHSGLGSDYTAAGVPPLKFDTEGDNVIVHYDQQAGEFSFVLKQNGQTAGTFTVYESANGEDYTPVWTGGDLGNAKSETITPILAAASRYVKFEYTTKPSGTNYGLGSISIQKPDFRQEASLTWSVGSVTLNQGDNANVPTLSNPNGLTLTSCTTTNDAVATVSPEGVITLVGAIGTTTITATFEGNEDYKPAEVSCTITVVKEQIPTGTFALYTGEIVEGDYVIVYDNFAMNTTSSAALRLQYQEVTPAENKLVNPASQIVWHVAANGEYWTLYNDYDEVYAVSTGVKNQATTAKEVTDKAKWSISGTETYDMANLDRENGSDPDNKYLRKNSDVGFACYKDATGGQLTLYRKQTPHIVTVAACTNGSVSASGVVDTKALSGDIITLSNTPEFDYQFVGYNVYKTGDETTVITVTNGTFTMPAFDVTISATFEAIQETTITLSGKFSTGEYEYAEFATGNLQHNPKSGDWRFAKQQYQYVGKDNIYVGKEDYKGWIDLFGWSADGNFGVNPSNDNANYQGEFVDWGTLFPEEGWSTLSKNQWNYLLNERTNAASLKQIAMVGETLGIMLFPDEWTLPAGCAPTKQTHHDEEDGEDHSCDFVSYNYTLAQWTELEKAGAIFLPAAGRRTGGWGNTTVSPHIVGTAGDKMDADGHYKHYADYYAYYWTSTKTDGKVNYLINCTLVDKVKDTYTVHAGHVNWAEEARYGQSVRLAKVTSTAYTRIVTNGNYGTICLPYASSNYTGMELYEVSWLKAETGLYLDQLAAGAQLVAGKPYIFRATASEITVTYTGDAKAAPVAGANGLTGTFTDIATGDAALVGNYIIAQNQIWVAGANNSLPANRAYINATLVPTTEQPKLAGRRRVCMGENAATGLDNITNGENTTIKVIENGQLIIIRNGEKFNAQGVRF